jgi:hypothetical protein
MSSIESVKVDLPLPAASTAKEAVVTCNDQSTLLKLCPLYGKTKSVQDAVVEMDAAAAVLDTTVKRLDVLHAEISTLESTRDGQLVTLRLKHDGVTGAIDSANADDPTTANQWTGRTKTRAPRRPPSASTDPPLNAHFNNIKSRPGGVKASCDRDPDALCYLYQYGTDPKNPDGWAGPSTRTGNTFSLYDQPIGLKLYVRIAIVRRGSGQSQWSALQEVIVR